MLGKFNLRYIEWDGTYRIFGLIHFTLILTFFLYDEFVILNNSFIRIDSYSSPAYFMVLSCIITLSLLAFVFADIARTKPSKGKKSKSMMNRDELAGMQALCGLTVYDVAILGCMMLNVVTQGTIGSFETVGVAFAESIFNLQSSFVGFVVGICGSLGVLVLLSIGHLSMFLTDVQLIAGGMMFSAFGILSLAIIP
ncbi:MAG: hypothetical protein ACREOZ_04435, partial [Gloeomargaritales cyanobacterium]